MKQQDATPSAQGPEQPPALTPATSSTRGQTRAGVAIALAALGLAWGAWPLPGPMQAEDGGAGLLPALCAAALLLCGLWLVWEARHGGWRHLGARSGAATVNVTACAWVSAGMLLSGLLMPHSGFVLAASLCYVLALQGLRVAAQPALRGRVQRWAVDAVVGAMIAGVVYALFTRVLGIALPAGWLAWS